MDSRLGGCREELSLGALLAGTSEVPSRHRKWLVCTEGPHVLPQLLQQVLLSEVLGL